MYYIARFDVVLEFDDTEHSGFVACADMLDAVKQIEGRYGMTSSCTIRLYGNFFAKMTKEEADNLEVNCY